MNHSDEILDQFTRQAAPFADAPIHRAADLLERIVRMADPQAEDSVLDVACGPGLVTCALARVVRQARGIDCTPAMLDQARRVQAEQGLSNLEWDLGDAAALPYRDHEFSIVCTRFSLHHILDPSAVLREMRRVCRPGGRVVVADSSPNAARADAFNAMERLRDPSHVRALPVAELCALFAGAGLGQPTVDHCRLEDSLDDLLRRSFPREGDEARIRQLFEDSFNNDVLDMAPKREDGQIFCSFPIAILGTTVPAE